MCNIMPKPKPCSIKSCLRPLITSGVHTGIIMTLGDFFAQTYWEKKDWDQIDLKRSLKFGAIGFVYGGPVIAFWNSMVRSAVPRRAPFFEKVIYRVVTTQVYLAPALNYGILGLSGAVKNETISKESFEKGLNYFVEVMEKNYMVWPITHALTTIIFPSTNYVKFVVLSAISIFWASYLSTTLMQ
ncbi:hypothetical protein GQX74_011604 [Glossina fuscipes]|uniref:Mitochondrial inner membrane protein Mpv17 n=2 Tax=Glossina TaxID=7393 RepID=A0A1B0BMM9_9MUSC|nr:hypothetical protein GQX74_011604 [Glossina fuscipes]